MEKWKDFLDALKKNPLSDITEHSHRPELKALLKAVASENDRKADFLHEPKREKGFGAPDFKVTTKGSIMGYIENKKIEERLADTLKTSQLKRYTELSGNILLTNYIEWIWLKDGKPVESATLCTLTDIEYRKSTLNEGNAKKVEELILRFLSQPHMYVANVKKLAEALAIRAKWLKEFLLDELKHEKETDQSGRLYQLYETFQTYVFQELNLEKFADAFAQNLVYGLFLARLNAPEMENVTLYNVKQFIPGSFELIRELVQFLNELDDKKKYGETQWIIEEVLTIINHMDLREIQRSLFYRASKKTDHFGEDEYDFRDPFIYFYEDFLAVYDRELREKKGVYYTPPPIVHFIVRAAQHILETSFNIRQGLADSDRVTVLDFATGTGTFLLEVFQQCFDKLPSGSGKKNSLIRDHLLRNMFGFEYLIAPYTIAHLKLSQFLKEQGYELKDEERLQIFLTNTLEHTELQQLKIPLLPALTEETKRAQKVKNEHVLIITGNPPYSGHSENKGEWITEKIRDYFFVDGKPLGEKNPKWLHDDYVKFIRFAQHKMEYETLWDEKAKQFRDVKHEKDGIVAIITNHSFLDNPTFRGMRQNLMKTFEQLWFIDLHGSLKKKEKTPEGGKDENVFDIQQGVAISIMVKKKGLQRKVMHADWWGLREEKYNEGWSARLEDVQWTEVNPIKPFYLFRFVDEKLNSEYQKCPSVKEIFKVGGTGIVTKRDNLSIHFDQYSVSFF